MKGQHCERDGRDRLRDDHKHYKHRRGLGVLWTSVNESIIKTCVEALAKREKKSTKKHLEIEKLLFAESQFGACRKAH